MRNILLSLTSAFILMLSPVTHAFEVNGESFPAEFEVASVTSTATGSVLTAEGDIADYGRVFLTYNLEGVHGLSDLGHFSGQIRAVTREGVMYGTLNGVYRMKEGKMHIHTFDTHSNGDIVMAIGTIDLIEGKASFTVYPES
tara:strand:- start:90 stop:515 length:426 start_codon:yes stop_codon:yes gene_type:complete